MVEQVVARPQSSCPRQRHELNFAYLVFMHRVRPDYGCFDSTLVGFE